MRFLSRRHLDAIAKCELLCFRIEPQMCVGREECVFVADDCTERPRIDVVGRLRRDRWSMLLDFTQSCGVLVLVFVMLRVWVYEAAHGPS